MDQEQPSNLPQYTVTFNPTPPPLPDPVRVAMAYMMACYNCNGIMQRGTQCPNCGAWCR